MADDLSQFFAKKSAKARDKRKKVKLSVEEVGLVLERKAKRQEERDREDEQEERHALDDAVSFDKRTEDSEWLEYKDTNKEIPLEELGIRDMNLTEQTEEALEDEKAATNEAPRTWSVAEKKEPEEMVLQIPKKQTPAVWKPRCLMRNAVRTDVAPNIDDQEIFPTFKDAEKIEKMKNDEKKRRHDGFTTVTSDKNSSGGWVSKSSTNNPWHRVGSGGGSASFSVSDRSALLSTVKQITSSGPPHSGPPSRVVEAANPNVYTVPSRRRAQMNMLKE
ncbi:unnamed protein product [Thelazia callipaeda]|uniref:Protein CDV3 homolog n=1 Tax=Thelazia callipaeda TaxID=103827 RepID=A0A0N5D2D5_THECL|nr:unnamed protein product [Thelazia callipaeda]